MEDWKKVQRGPGWSSQVSKTVVQLNYQASHILSDFEDGPLLSQAVKNYCRVERPLSLGKYYKSSFQSKAEKQVRNGIAAEYEKLLVLQEKQQEQIKQRENAEKVFSVFFKSENQGKRTYRSGNSLSKRKKLLNLKED